MDYLLSASLVFFLVALAFQSYYLLFMASTLHLTVIGVYLHIFKAFDKVWHHGLLYKLETYGIRGEVSNPLQNYLHKRYQRVALNGQTFSLELKKSGVLQGSALGPLMFLIYINDVSDNIQPTCKIFADDTLPFSHVSDKSRSQSELNKDLQGISNWTFHRKMQFNPDLKKQAQEAFFEKN